MFQFVISGWVVTTGGAERTIMKRTITEIEFLPFSDVSDEGFRRESHAQLFLTAGLMVLAVVALVAVVIAIHFAS